MRPLESVRACRDAATGGIGDEFGAARLRGRIPTRRSRARTLTRVTWAKTGAHNPRAPAPGAPAGAGAVATARRRRAAAGSRGRRACGAAPAPVRRRAQGTRMVRGASESRPAGTAMPATPTVSMARGNATKRPGLTPRHDACTIRRVRPRLGVSRIRGDPRHGCDSARRNYMPDQWPKLIMAEGWPEKLTCV